MRKIVVPILLMLLLVGCWNKITNNGIIDNSHSIEKQNISNESKLKENIKIISTSIGSEHALAIKADGTVWAWGNNEFGQLGDGSKENSQKPILAKDIAEVSEIYSGTSVSYAIKKDGTLIVWPRTFNSSEIGKISNLSNVKKFANNTTSIALTDTGNILLWGDNSFGEIGDGTKGVIGKDTFGNYMYDETNKEKQNPVMLKSISDVVDIAAGVQFNLAVKKDGTVWTWGRQKFVNLSIGSYDEIISIPTQVQGIDNVSSISAGQYICALKKDGTVWMWGDRSTPEQVKGLKNIVRVVSGDFHFLALDKHGNVWAWGENRYGEIGDGTLNKREEPVKVKELSEIIDISAGGFSSVAISKDGTVWTWGNNENGQLGIGNKESKAKPQKVEF